MGNIYIHNTNIKINDYLVDYIDGLLLSDGHISRRNVYTGRYMQPCKDFSWLSIISEYFSLYGVVSIISKEHIHKDHGNFNNITFDLSTLSYVELIDFHNRWYIPYYYEDKDGYEKFRYKKIVPSDINLTPGCVANWYLGDGHLHKDKRYITAYTLSIATMGFTKDDIFFLSDKINLLLDINSNVSKDGKIFISTRSEIISFLDYIKGCEYPDCYAHKFDIKPIVYKTLKR